MTRRPVRHATLLALLSVMALAVASPAAADVSCTGTIGAQTVDDNVRVPAGASCMLAGTTVKGNVLVGPGASLSARDATVDGNIQDDNSDAGPVSVVNSRVIGNVQLEQGTSATITGNRIDGDLQLESNRGALRADGNRIDGNLQANQNSGGLTINRNTIDGNLQCQSNNPAPTGGGNVVHGSAEDQCARSTGTSGGSQTSREKGRLGGATRLETAVRITQEAYPQGAAIVYLARADAFPDALVGGNLGDGPILLVPACGTVPGVVLDEIRRLDPQRVVALGGTAAVCDAVLDAAANA